MCTGIDPDSLWSATTEGDQVTIMHAGARTVQMPVSAAVAIFGEMFRQNQRSNSVKRETPEIVGDIACA